MNPKLIIIPGIIGIFLVIGVLIYSSTEENNTTTEPQDTTTEPQDTTTEPQDTTTEPQDTTTEPQDTTTEPQDTTTEPQDTTTEPPDVDSEQSGVVEGIVYYVGMPCGDNKRTPPCDGPYPDYEVTIFKIDGKTIVTKIFTDNDGKFEEPLPSDAYLVYGKIKGFGKLEEVPIQFTVEPKKTISLEILIDEGIR